MVLADFSRSSRLFLGDHRPSPARFTDRARKLAKHLDKAVHVRLVVINMRADAQATETRGDENNPPTSFKNPGFNHAVEAIGPGRILYIAGDSKDFGAI
jgi:hypothetical protein